MNTNLKVKKKYLPKFFKWMEKQLLSGGKRYKLSNDKEMTDIICEVVGTDWMVGNVIKYITEYKNERREVNLVKAANYCFLIWLKDQGSFNTKKDKGEE